MKFRKKPVVIEAWHFAEPLAKHPSWLSDALTAGTVWWQGGDDPHYTIATYEGDMRAVPGDWIIKGVAGELYPCKPSIFAATYEPVEEQAEEAA